MKKLFTLLFVAVFAFAMQAQEFDFKLVMVKNVPVLEEEVIDLLPGNNNDWVNTVDVNYDHGFTMYGHFYFIINGVNYGAPGEEPVYVPDELMGNSANTPLVEGSCNTYYVDYLFSYNLGIHLILDDDLNIVGYTAYIAKGGPVVEVEELATNKTVANVRYYNMAGQEMQNAEGMTIKVTTYTDGTTNTVKVIK